MQTIHLWSQDEEPNKVKLLNAALLEFAEKGYTLGSTNQIVQNAGISKGMLFHFFSNKKTLYLYIVDACLDYFQTYLKGHMQMRSSDLLDRVAELGMARMKLFFEEPLIYRLAVETFVRYPAEIREEIAGREQQVYASYLTMLLEGLDSSVLREGISPARAADFLITAVEALIQKHVRPHVNQEDKGLDALQQFFGELSTYMDMVRYGLYR
ncbi:TetR family transcriptional regulator [Brevibacillus borstelensis AK1]|uniref:TetR family transcriptional regulator n=1 Tax=Brevibacillus borstelensis AK1 TaxID=1300222 RepID=M8E821_9BACL|nr:TetR/AcrR family transcriptional regulator [Brevibacillus borstelensis]EMT51585.1 TetR family transcriptional regulator [Brevibacillus borstelensis AK1]